MIISQLSVSSVGEGTSLSKYVKIVIEILKNRNIKFHTNAMATVIETTNLKELFEIIEIAHKELLLSGVKRIIIELKIDDRQDKSVTIESKLNSIK